MDVICENKRFIGFFLASGLISIRPQLFTGVFLGVLGFGTLGPVGGSIAAAVQSMITPVATGGLFAILQSAAMDGYGAAKVHAIMALGGVVGMGLAVIDRFHGN
ncbi:hypothetical protein EV356DRAFT_518228 [Viridothelium virens]|uniref:Uncharacterized protein n=1 Tax=Viridothelium virens TaxID=1048519 RepID=A0A6A6H1V2_VIRVR|nr:hypothetical protein EV356DRAFT_518228 [Viridothelium virens]